MKIRRTRSRTGSSAPANLTQAALLLAASGTAYADTLCVPHLGDSSVRTADANGVTSSFATNGFNYSSRSAFDSADNLSVTSYYFNTITKFTPEGVGSVLASGRSEPSFIAIIPKPSTRALLAADLSGLFLFCPRTRRAGACGRPAN